MNVNEDSIFPAAAAAAAVVVAVASNENAIRVFLFGCIFTTFSGWDTYR